MGKLDYKRMAGGVLKRVDRLGAYVMRSFWAVYRQEERADQLVANAETRERTVIHEMGHYFFMFLAGQKVGRLWINPYSELMTQILLDGRGFIDYRNSSVFIAGTVFGSEIRKILGDDFENYLDSDEPDGIANMVVILLAGMAAEQVFLGADEDKIAIGGNNDMKQLQGLLSRKMPEGHMDDQQISDSIGSIYKFLVYTLEKEASVQTLFTKMAAIIREQLDFRDDEDIAPQIMFKLKQQGVTDADILAAKGRFWEVRDFAKEVLRLNEIA